MTLKYWLKIVAGMLAIFAVGAFVRMGFHKGEAFVNSDQAITLPLLGVPFKVGDEALGKIQRVRIERSAPRSVSGIALTVSLNDSVSLSRLEGCSLALTDASGVNKNIHFTCSAAGDSANAKLVSFGTVTFRPGDHQVVLLAPETLVAELRHNGITGAGQNDSGTVDMSHDSGSFHVRINGKDIVSIVGDSEGGTIKVYDRSGNKLVDVRGDSTGGRVQVNDAAGKSVVDVKGSNTAPRKPITP